MLHLLHVALRCLSIPWLNINVVVVVVVIIIVIHTSIIILCRAIIIVQGALTGLVGVVAAM